MEILVTTSKAPFSGIIISNNYKHISEVINYVDTTLHNIYTVKHKHISDDSKPAYICKDGCINVYGWFFTDNTLSPNDKYMIIEDGWFQKKYINTVIDIDSILNKMKK